MMPVKELSDARKKGWQKGVKIRRRGVKEQWRIIKGWGVKGNWESLKGDDEVLMCDSMR